MSFEFGTCDDRFAGEYVTGFMFLVSDYEFSDIINHCCPEKYLVPSLRSACLPQTGMTGVYGDFWMGGWLAASPPTTPLPKDKILTVIANGVRIENRRKPNLIHFKN